MINNWKYVKGGNEGAIMEMNDGSFIAVLPAFSKTYKTFKGAEKFMKKFEYELDHDDLLKKEAEENKNMFFVESLLN